MPNKTINIVLLIFLITLSSFGQNQLDSLLHLVNSKKGIEKAKLFNEIARAIHNSDPKLAIEYSYQAKSIADSLDNDVVLGDAYLNIGNYNSQIGNFTAAKENLFKALALYRQAMDTLKIGTAFGRLGTTYNSFSVYDSALFYLRKGQTIAEQIKDLSGFHIANINIGVVFQNQGNHKKALKVLLDALRYYEKTNDKESRSVILNNIGNIYIYLKDYEKALGYFNEYYAISYDSNNLLNQDIALNNIGECFEKLGKLEEALDRYNQALIIAKSIDDFEGIGIINYCLGRTYGLKGDFAKAQKYLVESLAILQKYKITREEAIALQLLGELYLKTNQIELAVEYLSHSLALAKKLSINDEIIQNYKLLAEAYDKKGFYKDAYSYFKLYKAYNDSLLEENNRLIIAELENEYENEKSLRENELLKRENELQKQIIESQQNIVLAITIGLIIFVVFIFLLYTSRKKIKVAQKLLNEQNTHLEEVNAEKDKFFSILAHDLKNPFGTIVNTSEFLFNQYKDLPDSERTELIKTINSASRNVNRLLENLLNWARTQLGALTLKKEELLLKELITISITPYLTQAATKEVRIVKKDISDDLLVNVDKYMLLTVLGNLTNNAIKFSYPHSTINISGIQVNGNVEISISDEGVGMDEETISNLFKVNKSKSSHGTQNEKGTGLGLIICKDFITKHDGSLIVESKVGKGTTVKVKIPNQ